jgi:phosphoenolpyruvate phosphomutase
MKALILASGLGKRLLPLTNDSPKALVMVKGKPLLGRILNCLVKAGINDVVITTGHLEGKIREYVKNSYPDLKVEFVVNPQYETTNYIYSMWLAREFLKEDDIIYLHSDIYFDPELLKKVINFSESGVLIKKGFVSKKDFNARVEKGQIKEIAVKVAGKAAGFCLPLYKMLKEDFGIWIRKIDEYVKNNEVGCYAEKALNEVMEEMILRPVYFKKEYALEIDDYNDLKIAEALT